MWDQEDRVLVNPHTVKFAGLASEEKQLSLAMVMWWSIEEHKVHDVIGLKDVTFEYRHVTDSEGRKSVRSYYTIHGDGMLQVDDRIRDGSQRLRWVFE